MSKDEHTPSPTPEDQETPVAKEEPKKAPAYVPPDTKEKRQKSVFKYITILFAAAFVLMLLTFMMERRQNEQVVDSLNQSVSGLRESLSNMQSAQDIYEGTRYIGAAELVDRKLASGRMFRLICRAMELARMNQ